MDILIVGAGAIGSLLGGRLALAGHQVTMVGRLWLQEAVAREGLTIVTDNEARTVHDLRVLTSTQAAFDGTHHYEYVLLTPKAYALPAAISEVEAAAGTIPPLVTFQNGVGSEEVAARIAGTDKIVAATITTPVEALGKARIGTVSKGGIGLARWIPGGPDLAPLAHAFDEAGFQVELYEEPRSMKWSKLLLNMVGNATSAILGWPPERTFSDPRLFHVEVDALQEARRVMQAQGIKTVGLPGYPAHLLFALLSYLPRKLSRPLMKRIVAGGRGGKMPSLYLGLESERKESEVEVLNGAVVAAGEALAIPTPVNRVLTDLVKALARGEIERARFYHRPEALLREIRQAGDKRVES